MAPETNSIPYFLTGGGEMGSLIRAHDWSKTPLGPIDLWPQSLRTAVSIMLENPFGMYIAWGAGYTQLYNDGYRPILGSTKHPKALGISTRETFAEIWHIIGPMFDGVMQGQAVGFPGFMLPLDRNGYIEECFFDFSYSPIRKEDGTVGGVLVTVIETTEKLAQLKQIREIGERYQFAMEAAELGTWDLNPTTNRFTGNARLKEWFGLGSEEEIELSTALAAIAGKDLNRVIEAIQKALTYASGGLYETDYTIVHPLTGLERIVKAKGRAYFNEDKVAYRFNGILQDITEEISARQALIQSEKNFRNMILQAPVAVSVMRGAEYVVEIANEKMFELWGKNPDEVLGRPMFEGLPEAKEQGLEALLDHVLATGERFQANERMIYLPRNGEIKPTYINFVYEALKEGDGTISGILAVATEVTEQVEARQQIGFAEERARLAIDAANIGTFDLNMLTDQMITSPRFNAIFGLDGEPSHEDYLAAMHPADNVVRMEAHKNAAQTGRLFYEARTIWKDGSVHWIRAEGKMYHDEQGKPVRLLGTVLDITKEKNAREELEEKVNERTLDLKEANLRLERSNSELEQFAYVASHDLQEPLRKIKAFGDMLRNRYAGKLGNEGSDMIDRMQSASERMRALIEDLLTFSRVSSNKNPFELVDLNGVIEDILTDMETTIREKGASFDIGRLLPVKADPLQMRQLFQNLIGNALKFSKDEIKPLVSITSQYMTGAESGMDVSKEDASKGFQRIIISDNGIGFEQEYSKKIFQIFQRLHGRTEYPGAGMGLSIVQKAVENHHGYISAIGKPGEGATFTILLPATGKIA